MKHHASVPNIAFQYVKLHQYGYTLIELIIVFSIIAIASTVGIGSFVSYNNTQILNASASNLATVFQTARSNAQVQKKPSVCSSAQSLQGYRVRVEGASNRYRLQVLCLGLVRDVGSPTVLPSGISFGNRATRDITFRVISGVVENSGTFVLQGFGKTKSIIVGSNGGVSIQ